MSHSITWIDGLRIERLVWMLDQRLYGLPRKSRIANRREVRENLFTAAHDIGTTGALKHLGSSRELAAAYFVAEFGEGPRAYWVTAGMFATAAQLLFLGLLSEEVSALGRGIKVANPHATGTFTLEGLRYLQETVTYTFSHGNGSYVGGTELPLAWALWIISTVMVGRLWRLQSTWRRHRPTTIRRGKNNPSLNS